MRRSGLRLLLAAGLLLAGGLAAIACRYSVRDTGFVDLGTFGYRLQLVAPPGTDPMVRMAVEHAAAALLADSAITLDTPVEGRPGDPPRLKLVHPDGSEFALGEIAPDGSGVMALVGKAVSSPLRERLLQECLRAYAVVVLVEGSNDTANQRARTAMKAAIAATDRLLPGMPKPVSVGPQALVVTVAEQAAEAITLWSLGVPRTPSPEPSVAIYYGRGRRLGTLLEGPLITETALRERLVLIGQDCECELDRAWLKGPLLAARWDQSLQVAASRTLGFDPENPNVRAEVSRIVERGPQAGQRRKTAGTAQALGYSEEAVDAAEPSEQSDKSDRSDASDKSDSPTPPPAPTALERLRASTPQAPIAPPAFTPPQPIPTQPDPVAAHNARRPALRLWRALAGLATIVVVTGIWFARRSRTR